MNDFDNMLWAYRAVFKQTDGGGGTVIIRVAFNERAVILYGSIGPDDYAAGRSISASILDSAGNTIARVLIPSAIDNYRVPIIDGGNATALNTERTISPKDRLVVGSGEQFVIQATSLALNEEVTLTMRGLTSSSLPTITTTGSAGTVTTTTTYNKVI